MPPVLFFIQMPLLGDRFWEATLIQGAVNIAATILYTRALKLSDVSIIHPMTAFSPLFLLLTAPIFLGEFPDAGGLIGVLLIIAGAHCMNISKFRECLFAPFKALLKEKCPWLMPILAFLWSISTNYDKIGILIPPRFSGRFSLIFFLRYCCFL
ncbi:MAG: hypothetical protein DRN66_01195 [Candidatus Nanohalarchaeota archaeon]|nr:MAG: hypothetical protein DRN66_01195 [Candidatus Nanohaloarchaeota archaeon]